MLAEKWSFTMRRAYEKIKWIQRMISMQFNEFAKYKKW